MSLGVTREKVHKAGQGQIMKSMGYAEASVACWGDGVSLGLNRRETCPKAQLEQGGDPQGAILRGSRETGRKPFEELRW